MKESLIENKKETSENSKYELKDYDFDTLSRANSSFIEPMDDNIRESIPESVNNENILEKSVILDYFISYFDYFMSIFLYINSFIYFSYINIFHLIYSFYLLYSKYSSYYTFILRSKKKITFLLLCC